MKKVVKKSSVKKAQSGAKTEKKYKPSVKDMLDIAVPVIPAMKSYGKGIKDLREQITPINKRMPKKKTGGAVKAKSGGSFPDLNKDGKITKADILKGRGVIAKKGAKLKKQAATAIAMKKAGKTSKTMKSGGKMKKCEYGCK